MLNDKYGRKEESLKVKKFLVERGYRGVAVHHGKGTARGWIHVLVNVPLPTGCYCRERENGTVDRCDPCKNNWREHYDYLNKALPEFTGRTGDYGGRIGIDIHHEKATIIIKTNSVLQTILAEV